MNLIVLVLQRLLFTIYLAIYLSMLLNGGGCILDLNVVSALMYTCRIDVEFDVVIII